MFETRRTLAGLTLGLASAFASTASAQVNGAGGEPAGTILLPSTSSYYNQQGFNLPSAPRATGQDVVRGSGGISCQSAVNGNGPVVDMGMIGTEDPYGRGSASVYGRVTIPLGKSPRRVDCTRLYDMELQRLTLELEMLRGASAVRAPDPLDGMPDWDRVEAQGEVEGKPPQPFNLGDIARVPRKDADAASAASVGIAPVKVASAAPVVVGTPMPVAPAAPERERPPAKPLCAPDDGGIVWTDGQPSCDGAGAHSVQIAAYRTAIRAREAWEAMREGVVLPARSQAVVRERVLPGRTLFALQIDGLTRAGAERLCADFGGDCIVRHAGRDAG